MAIFQLHKEGMPHAVDIGLWFNNGFYWAQSSEFILKANTLEDMAASIAMVVKEMSADEVMKELNIIDLNTVHVHTLPFDCLVMLSIRSLRRQQSRLAASVSECFAIIAGTQ
ncbi:hypothetical protein CWS02_15475 [Enterobacter sp. EA-1]|nr:hypothetical protein CWS02_15475 [Enterobacter sp. EA-1]